MKKLFKKKKGEDTVESKQKKTEVHLPFSKPGEKKEDKKDIQDDADLKKTQIGVQADMPFSSAQEKETGNDSLNCPKCDYPLRTQPASSSPCPNCGYAGDDSESEDKSHKTVPDGGKTTAVHGLEEASEVDRFHLVNESNNNQMSFDFPGENERVFNRSHLDPENATIAQDQHIIIRQKEKSLFIRDVSPDGSTYMQAKNEMPVESGSHVIMGNKIFLFESSAGIQSEKSEEATRKVGEIETGNNENEEKFFLTDATSGKLSEFSGDSVLINRMNLDPGNNTISGSKHAEFTVRDGEWIIKDLSSNESTFVQLKGTQLLENKIRIVIGNRIFRFETV